MLVYNNADGSTGIMKSSMGNQLKMCIGDTWYKADFLGYEGAVEFLASQLMAQTNLLPSEFVDYQLTTIEYNGKQFNGCISKDFKKPGEQVITAYRLLKKLDIPFYRSLNTKAFSRKPVVEQIEIFVAEIEKLTGMKDYGVELTKLLEIDYLTLNEDRHLNNIAFLYNHDAGTYRPTPIFDCGMGFLSDLRFHYDLDESVRKQIRHAKAKPFSSSFEKQVSACRELYGQQIVVSEALDLTKALDIIKEQYGNPIAMRCHTICKLHTEALLEKFQEPEMSYDYER